jgi:predicted nuclease of predicted toxin-antitoxin system
MKLLLDANLSWRLTKLLEKDFSVNHILDYFKHNEKDSIIWNFAKEEQYTIVTNDEDFIDILSAYGWPPKVILLKTGNQSNNFLLNLLISKKVEITSFENNSSLGLLVIG